MTDTASSSPAALDEEWGGGGGARGRPPAAWGRTHFDHLAPELGAHLPETLSTMRKACPVARSDRYGGFWVVTRYEDVLAVAQDWEAFSSASGLTVPVAPIAVRNLPVEIDPPLHRVFKRLINAYFTPAAVAPWEDRTRRLVTRLVDAFVEEGRCEFMAELARPYPATSFFEAAINAPAEDIAEVAYMASKAGAPNDPEAAACWTGLSEWIREFISARRGAEPVGDVVDAIIAAEVEGRPITEEEIIGTVQLLILGGLETTAGALGSMMIRFCREPGIADRLRGDPSAIPAAVEELLRHVQPGPSQRADHLQARTEEGALMELDGVRVYRAEDAPGLHESGATRSDFAGNTELLTIATKLASSDCSISKLLLHQSGDEGGLSIVYLFFKPGFPLFRHAHDVDSLYVVISGSVVDFMGHECLHPGDIWSVKAGTPYWYTAGADGVEVLEIFRDADTATIIYTENPPGRLEAAEAAVRANESRWKSIGDGPLFRANAAARQARSDRQDDRD